MEVAMSILRDLAIFAQAFTNILIKISNKEKLFTVSFLGEVVAALGSAQQIIKKIEEDSVGKSLSKVHQYVTAPEEGQEPVSWSDSLWFFQSVLFKGIYDFKLFFNSVQSSAQSVQSMSIYSTNEESNNRVGKLEVATVPYLSTTAAAESKPALPAIAPYVSIEEEKSADAPLSTVEILEEKSAEEITERSADGPQGDNATSLDEQSSTLLRTAEQGTAYGAVNGHIISHEQQRSSGTISATVAGANVGLVTGAVSVNASNPPAPTQLEERIPKLEQPTLGELSGMMRPPIQSGNTAVADLGAFTENGDSAGDDGMLSGVLGLGADKLTIGSVDNAVMFSGSNVPMTGDDSAGVVASAMLGVDSVDIVGAADGCGCSPSDLGEVCLPLCAIL
jgi:hypothetical protein